MSAKFTRDGDASTPIERRHPNFAASIGLVAFWLAFKFMKRYPATLDDLIKYSNNQLQADVLRKAEREVFQVLNWNINYPTVCDFTRHHSQVAFGDEEHFMMKSTIHLKDVARARLYPILYTLTKQTQNKNETTQQDSTTDDILRGHSSQFGNITGAMVQMMTDSEFITN